jgi:hypothetical protein
LAVAKSLKFPWNAVAISKKQVKSVLFDNVRLENPEDHGGCDFLHHFLSGVVKGTIPKKKFFELTVLKTAITRGQTWKDCIYHEDLSDPPEAFLNNEESVPITLYFAIDDKNLHLDVEPKRPKTGCPPTQHTLKLNAGDILLFDACNTKHRTSKPTKNTFFDISYSANKVRHWTTTVEQSLLEVVKPHGYKRMPAICLMN